MIDDKPGELTEDQVEALEALARQAVRTMELRRHAIDFANLEELHKITSQDMAFRDKVRDILEWGCRVFKLPMGIVSRIDGDVYTVFDAVATQDPPPPGMEFELGKTYCAHTVAAKGPTGFHQAGKQIADHPCYQEFGLESYIGAPLIVDGKRFGTVNFSGPDSRELPFLDRDFALMLLLSQWIGFEISREGHIAELNALKDSLKEANENLSDKVAELDQFAYVVSHDLKAPLRAISSLADWIKEDMGDNIAGESEEHLSLLKKRALRMESLINGILEYSRIGRHDVTVNEIDLQKLLPDIIDSLAPPEGFEVKLTNGMPVIYGNRSRLFQLFSNLIGNGIKYHHKDKGVITVGCEDGGAEYTFRVEDDGPGIEPQFQDRIFGVFQTLQRRDEVESTGIGLSVVQKIVNTNGGRVWVESDGKKGSTFAFTWPKEKLEKE